MNGTVRAWVRAVVAISVLGPATAGGQSTPADARRTAQMREHYFDAVDMHAAVIRSDLAAVASLAKGLTDYAAPPGMPDRSAAYAATIQRAARDAAAATTIVSAAVSSAVMLNACGQCHQLAGVRPSLTIPRGAIVGGVVGHMIEHQRAADQIFQGLVTPSDSMWRDGTRALAKAPLSAADLPIAESDRRKLALTEARIHRLASDAAAATEPRARANYYGQLLAGCADCHGHPKVRGPGQ